MGVSIRQYAKERGCSHEAVRRAIAAGRLKKAVTKKGRNYDIDILKANQEWELNTDDTKQNNMGSQATIKSPSLAQARAVREMYAARLTQLEFEEKSGLLCKVADVKLEYFQKTRVARDALLNVPVRVVSELGGLVGDITDQQRHDILQLLNQEMNSALEQLAEEDDGTS